MALPLDLDSTWVNPASKQLDAGELRRADGALFAGDGSALGARGGIVRHGDTSLLVSVSASDVVTIQPGPVVIPGNAVSGTGCYRSALAAAVTGNLAARDATNSRIDLVVFRQLDTDVVGSHAAYTARIEILAGTPSSTPSAPALPSMAVELARIPVPVSGGGNASVDLSRRTYAVALGGILPVATEARLPVAAALWQKAVALDTGVEYQWDGTTWHGAWRIVGAAGQPAFQNSWVNFNSGYAPARFAKRNGIVYVEGLVRGGPANVPIFTLPAGCRPSGDLVFATVANDSFARFTVTSLGTVVSGPSLSPVWGSITATFPADA